MTSTLDLTATPLALKLNLTPAADFVRIIEAVAPDTFPVGSQVILDFGATEWAAVVTPTEVTWNVDKAQVDALIATSPTRVVLRFVNGLVDLTWAAGWVSIDAA